MMKLHSIVALTFLLALTGCGGGGGDDGPDTTSPSVPDEPVVDDNPPSTGGEDEPGVELATIPMAEGMDHLIPPGVPTLE